MLQVILYTDHTIPFAYIIVWTSATILNLCISTCIIHTEGCLAPEQGGDSQDNTWNAFHKASSVKNLHPTFFSYTDYELA